MKIHLDDGEVSNSWYQKPPDTGLMLSFRSMEQKIYEKNIMEGTIHRFFDATSSWENFDRGLK